MAFGKKDVSRRILTILKLRIKLIRYLQAWWEASVGVSAEVSAGASADRDRADAGRNKGDRAHGAASEAEAWDFSLPLPCAFSSYSV